MAAGDLDTAAQFADSIAWFLNYFGRWSERDKMMEQVSKMQDAGGKRQGSDIGDQDSAVRVPQSEFLMLSNQGERLLQLGRATEAERLFRALLARLGVEPSYKQAATFERLGRALLIQGKPTAAIEAHQDAVSTLGKLEQSDEIQRAIGSAQIELATALENAGRYNEAQTEYTTALRSVRRVDDKRNAGVVLAQLGTLALRQNNLDEARRRYLEALTIFRANNEPQSEAALWHQLGRAAQEARDWAEAERCYKESLALDERLNDAAGAAQTCNQLAIVAMGAGRPDEAEQWNLRAIELKEQVGNPQQLASSVNNLANLYLAQNRLDEAEQYVRRAIAIDETPAIPVLSLVTHLGTFPAP